MFRTPLATLLLLASTASSAQALLDPGFGSGGRRAIGFDEPGTSKGDTGVRLLIGPGDKYYVVGSVDVADANPNVVGIGLARLLPDGAFDTGFGGAATGKRVKNAALTSVADAALDHDKLLVVGGFNGDSAMVRFHPSGADDTGFAGDGGVVWDASGLGEGDAPQAVAEIRGTYFVAGRFDSAVGAPIDFDVFAGRVDDSSGALTVFLREELGGTQPTADRVVDLEPGDGGDFDSDGSFVLLADNESPAYAGTVMVIDTQSQARLDSIRLENLFAANATGCDPDHVDARSTDLVRMDDRRVAVVGNLMLDASTPAQAYVIVIDILTGDVTGVTCGPFDTGAYVVSGEFREDFLGLPPLHLATTVDQRSGYWRWSRDGAQAGIVYRPDPSIHAGQAVPVAFPSISGTPPLGVADSVVVDDEERPVVLGSRLWQVATGVTDTDFALFRLHATPTVFSDGFDEAF